MTTSEEDPWLPLRSHLANHSELAKLGQPSHDSLIDWLQSTGPFENLEQLATKLRKAKIKGINKQQRKCFLDSLRYRVTRRPFLATLGLGSAAAFAAGVGSLRESDEASGNRSEVQIRPLLAALQSQRRSVGNAVAKLLASKSPPAIVGDESTWKRFLHALDMSNWLEAAILLGGSSLDKQVRELADGTPITQLVTALEQVVAAWEYLQSTRSQWEEDYFIAYALGKMPALSTASASQPAVPDFDSSARESATTLFDLSSLFHALEIFNQRFQKPGLNEHGARVRFTQGHNFSYAHLAEDLLDSSLFDNEKQTVLVNWDAHADLGGPFENPRMLLDGAFDLLQNAESYAQRVVASSSMSIAGWILPLLQQGLLSSPEKISKIVWVAPREAHETSQNYMEPYGEYSFFVGEWRLPESSKQIAEQSTTPLGDWNIPGSTEIRKFGEQPMVRSVTSRELLENQHECKLYLVDPDDLSQLREVIGDSQIALSVDADFAGTREPGLTPRKGYLPHYPLTDSLAEQNRHQALLGRLKDFVATHGEQIRTISIANSPNFTVEEDTRKPVAQILKDLLGENLKRQPEWVSSEIARNAPRNSQQSSDLFSRVMTIGGISGITLTAGLLLREKNRLRSLQELLFSQTGKPS